VFSDNSKETIGEPGTTPAPANSFPERLGRYVLKERLGSGGFGVVYRALDTTLNRFVAIKLPQVDWVRSSAGMEAFLREARRAAELDHPHIVPVYDAACDGQICFIVFKLIDGISLSQRIKSGPIKQSDAARILATIADALAYAHERRIFHRDVKPANVLLDKNEAPYLADFGVAIRDDAPIRDRSRSAGTCHYMSPEQIRGEGHRIDGRTDIYSLGVSLYELLTRRRPFMGNARGELIENILNGEPRPLRQIDRSIDRTLEAICLKAMARRVSERYHTASDMAEELRDAAAQISGRVLAPLSPAQDAMPLVEARPAQADSTDAGLVTPRGLRSYGPEDHESYLQLIPGPRGPDGLPEPVRFWKVRLESRDPNSAFPVGILCGPSGCGKSSLVKAGLLPRLSDNVLAVYVDATGERTERNLAQALSRQLPQLATGQPLRETLADIRRLHSRERKVVLVLDQFEQWLYSHGQPEETELVGAIRQCDGIHLQCMLTVRDDFWMAASRFMRAVEIPLEEGRNFALLDLFDLRHARNVLIAFGRGYGTIPKGPGIPADVAEFLDIAVAELSQHERIVPVRLSVFADMLRAKSWDPRTLTAVGGVHGLGVAFLDEAISRRAGNPERRLYSDIARAILQALLPEAGVDIRGRVHSPSHLARACGHSMESPHFARALQILDRDLHIITAVQSVEGGDKEPSGKPAVEAEDSRGYQLTHDYLVPSIRTWLNRERLATWRTRAELSLEGLTAEWRQRREKRFLPSFIQLCTILLAVPAGKRTTDQQHLLASATRSHGRRVAAVVAGLMITGLMLWMYVAHLQAGVSDQRVTQHVRELLIATPGNVPHIVSELKRDRKRAVLRLRSVVVESQSSPQALLRAAIGLAMLGEGEARPIIDGIASASANECENIVASLRAISAQAIPYLDQLARPYGDTRASRYAIVLLHLGSSQAAENALAGPSAEARAKFIDCFATWHADVGSLLPTLTSSDTPARFRSGLCLCIGNVVPSTLDSDERQRVIDVLGATFLDDSDAGTHSAAYWALSRWGVSPPDPPRSNQPRPGFDWFVTPSGMTMVRIRAGSFQMGHAALPDATPHVVTIVGDFWLCDREVTVAQFEALLASAPEDDRPPSWLGHDRTVSPFGDSPMQNLSWYDCLWFANRLSAAEQRKECYRRIGSRTITIRRPGHKGEELREVGKWAWDRSARGYRLPTEVEWEYAAREAADFPVGDASDLLPAYGLFASPRTAPVATHMPNAWGLFDVLGNVGELCIDDYEPYPKRPSADTSGSINDVGEILRADELGILRGGAWNEHPWEFPHPASGRGQTARAIRHTTQGLRIALSTDPD
jgi:serine/threonine protein kinase/formylglycine-generating enzyme required for sulfatase activity